MEPCFLKLVTALIAGLLSMPCVLGSPTYSPTGGRYLTRRASDAGGSSNVLYAVLGVVVFVGVLGAITLGKQAYIRSRARAAASRNTAGSEQPTGLPRRPRRVQRTPSQVSTRSLPQYMLEPRDEDIVLLRSLPEDDGEQTDGRTSPRPSGDSLSMNGPIMTALDSSTPFLQSSPMSSSVDLAHHPRHTGPRASFDSGVDANGEIEMRARTMGEDPSLVRERGEAPAYFEAVSEQGRRSGQGSTTEGTSISPSPSQSISAFATIRNLLTRGSRVISPQDTPMAESPVAEATSQPPSIRRQSHIISPSISRISLAHSPSNRSTNRRGNAPAGPRPRSVSGPNGLTATGHRSSLSVNSIGSPLPHTLVRTEYTYPKAGPTPEQLAFLASTDTLTRFGVPFGQDARAVAAAERSDREMPPPSFEDIGLNSPAEAQSLHSRGASTSSSAFLPTVETVVESESPSQSHSLPDAVHPAIHPHSGSSPLTATPSR